MTRAENIRKLPKTGWGNILLRCLVGLIKRQGPTEFFHYQTRPALPLPFDGEWYVYWGGRSVAQNRHVVTHDQRFACDFLILARGYSCRSYRTSGENNTCYFFLGQLFYAPADGSVVRAEDELPDNQPGEMKPKA